MQIEGTAQTHGRGRTRTQEEVRQKLIRDCNGNAYNVKLVEFWEIAENDMGVIDRLGNPIILEVSRDLRKARLYHAPKRDYFDAGMRVTPMGYIEWKWTGDGGAPPSAVWAYHPERLAELLDLGLVG